MVWYPGNHFLKCFMEKGEIYSVYIKKSECWLLAIGISNVPIIEMFSNSEFKTK